MSGSLADCLGQPVWVISYQPDVSAALTAASNSEPHPTVACESRSDASATQVLGGIFEAWLLCHDGRMSWTIASQNRPLPERGDGIAPVEMTSPSCWRTTGK